MQTESPESRFRNAIAVRNFVQPGDIEAWYKFRTDLLAELKPAGAIETVHADEFISASWRLRLCAQLEATYGESFSTLETYIKSASCTSVDRMRTKAQRALRDASLELRRLQNEREVQKELSQPRDGLAETTVIQRTVSRMLKATPRRQLQRRGFRLPPHRTDQTQNIFNKSPN